MTQLLGKKSNSNVDPTLTHTHIVESTYSHYPLGSYYYTANAIYKKMFRHLPQQTLMFQHLRRTPNLEHHFQKYRRIVQNSSRRRFCEPMTHNQK